MSIIWKTTSGRADNKSTAEFWYLEKRYRQPIFFLSSRKTGLSENDWPANARPLRGAVGSVNFFFLFSGEECFYFQIEFLFEF